MKHVECKSSAKSILDYVKLQKNKKQLVIISVGDDPASEVYVKGKKKDAAYCDIPVTHIVTFTETGVAELIKSRNQDPSVGGIILQLPLPKGFNTEKLCNLIRPSKDVDGLVPNSEFQPCTPLGVMHIIHQNVETLSGQRVLVIGRSKLVGKPLAQMLLSEDATVTVAHSKTKNLDELLAENDIIISAVGKANLVDLTKCKRAHLVVDVGINRDENGKLCGDCYNFTDTGEGMLVTPVPGGIGLMTRAELMMNTYLSSRV